MKGKLSTVPIWPSLVTSLALCCGFVSVVLASWSGAVEFSQVPPGEGFTSAQLLQAAAFLIFAAMVFDGLDGRIARMTEQTTEFGAQLDSLADAISFGVAPAFLTVQMVRQSFPDLLTWPKLSKIVLAVAALYAVCTAIRLARFNVENVPDEWAHRYFKGLPSPAAAGLVAGLALLHFEVMDQFATVLPEALTPVVARYVLPAGTLLAALLMVSKVRFVHVVNAMLRGSRPYSYFILLLAILVPAIFHPYYSLALAFVVYVLSGLFSVAYEKLAERIDLMEEEGSFF